jgi:hypothetical protein
MKRIERTPLQKAVDDVVSTAMAFCNAHREKQSASLLPLLAKLLRATRRLERRSGKQ